MQVAFTIDDVRASIVTLVVSSALLCFSLWYTINMDEYARPSFIEVEFGEFKTGSRAVFSEMEEEEVATSTNSSDVETEHTTEETPDLLEVEKPSTDAHAKPVDLPDQIKNTDEESVQTPQTQKTNPTEIAQESTQDNINTASIAQQDVTTKEGAKESGDNKGTTGDTTTDQGLGKEDENTSPYNLTFEGVLDRTPLSQNLPENNTNFNATVTMGFEVLPNGRVGNIWPIRRSGNPELEKTVTATLKNWRFTRLPKGVPQTNQRGSITFKFIVE